jgi:O-antigen ligase
LQYSAFAITIILAYDLLRLVLALGSNLFVLAHSYRPFLLNHPNVSAMMAALSACVFIYEAYLNWSFKKSYSLIYVALFAICFFYIIVIASRGVQIAFLLTIFFAGFLMPGWKTKVVWLMLAAVLACGTGVVLVEKNPRYKELTEVLKIENRNKLIAHIWKKVLTERPTVWFHTYELIKKKPFFGYGYGKRIFREVYYSSEPPTSPFYYPHCHSFWLKLLFEFGVVGTAFHLAAWLLLAKELIAAMRRERSLAARSSPMLVALMLILLHIYGLFDYPDNLSLMALFWLVPLAIVISQKRAEKGE